MVRVQCLLSASLACVVFLAAWMGCFAACNAQTAQAARRVAFVVGIDRYLNLAPDKQLLKAANDARAMRDAFSRLGFSVIAAENASRIELLRRWQEFLNALSPGDEAAVFFAGHGIEIAGSNYLIPSDIPRVGDGEEEVLKGAAINVEMLLGALRDRSPRVSLVILDACRNNPFAGARGRSVGRSRGLADARPPSGTFIMYSAGSGQQALDAFGDNDANANSVYTRALIPLLMTPGLDITELARRVRREVHEQVQSLGHVQTPAYYDELIGEFCPAGCGAAGPDSTPPKEPPKTQEIAASQAPTGRTREIDAHPLDGSWLVTAKSHSCPIKSWALVWTVTRGEIFNRNDKQIGKLDSEGSFKMRLPSRVNRKVLGTFTGRLDSNKGEGSYTFPACSGTFVIQRL